MYNTYCHVCISSLSSVVNVLEAKLNYEIQLFTDIFQARNEVKLDD